MPKEQYKKYYMCEPIHKSNLENTYYKMRCYYNAKTELFDRGLSSLRGQYDNTSTFSEDKRKSNKYAYNLFQFCKEILIEETHHPFDYALWRLTDKNNVKLQYWIDECKRFQENGELNFLNKYKEISRNNIENIYYRVRCYYEIKSKIYRDELDFYSRYDSGISYVIDMIRLKASKGLKTLKDKCEKIVEIETKRPFDYRLWETISILDKYEYWLITYKKLKSNGELDFIEKYKFDEKEI